MSEVVETTTEVVTETKTVTMTKTVQDGEITTEVTTTTVVEGGETDATEEVKQNSVADREDVKENGGAEVAKDEEPAEAAQEQSADKIEEDKKEESPPKVILHQFPPGKNIPSISPFCLKLETFLRINKIPYENSYGYKAGKKGKLPWIEYKGEKVPDTNFIVDYLNKTFEVELEKDLSSTEKAQARAFLVMLEENTYWTVIYSRWVDTDAVNEWKKMVQPHSGGIGFQVSFKMNQRRLRSELDQHGMGRHSKEEVYEIAEKDLKALSDFLADKEYLLGAQPTTVDATAFGILANILFVGLETPQCKYIKENLQNVVDYAERIKSAFWTDWQEMVGGDKPEGHHTNITKKFSFRRSKKKSKDKKEEASTPTEENKTEEVGETNPAAEDPAKTDEEAKPTEEGEGEKKEEQPDAEKTESSEAQPQSDQAKPESEESKPHVNGDATEEEKAEAETKSD